MSTDLDLARALVADPRWKWAPNIRRIYGNVAAGAPHMQTPDVEQWRSVEGWPEYDVSSHGRVRSWRARGGIRRLPEPRILNGTTHHQRWQFQLKRGDRMERKYVHVLVLEAFVGPRPDDFEAAHLDGDPGNNAVGNLRWVSPAENWAHRRVHLRPLPWHQPVPEVHGGEVIACACLTVTYDPEAHADGTRSDRWVCSDCGSLFVRRPLTPWSGLASLAESHNALLRERDDARREVATLARQVNELLALGVSIHKAASRAVDEDRHAAALRLARMASDAHDAGRAERADAFAEAALNVEHGGRR